jgi:dolichyl-phosphate-mannose-protein mannosyltransferase
VRGLLRGIVRAMKFHLLPPSENRRPQSWLAVVLFLGVIGGAFIRFFWLSYPNVHVFDEVYFPVFAKDYLDRVSFFDVHPPLGKFIIAAGIWLFGDNGIGWRVMPMIFGLATIWLVGWLWYSYSKDKLASALVAFFVAIDGMFIAYSRTGLMDGLLFFFMFAALLAMVKAKEDRPLLLVATLLGCAVAVKWVGLAIAVPIALVAYKKGKFGEFLFSLWWSFGIYMVIVAVGQWLIGETSIANAVVEWHLQAARYQATLTATHPYSSPWWSWPLLTRPVLLIYDSISDGGAQVMTTLGNPLVWWSSTLAVLGSIIFLVREGLAKRIKVSDHPLFMPLLGWAAAFIPFALVHRVMFLYHYMPAYGFALIILAYWLSQAFKKMPWAVVVLCAVYLGVSLYMVPLFVGWWPLTAQALTQHVWFNHWIY